MSLKMLESFAIIYSLTQYFLLLGQCLISSSERKKRGSNGNNVKTEYNNEQYNQQPICYGHV